MDTTSVSLLERLRQPGADEAWGRFVKLYTPLLHHWATCAGLHDADAADLVQDVLTLLLRKLPQFTYDPQRSFRAWLRAVTVNQCRTRQRRPVLPREDGACPDDEIGGPSAGEVVEEAEYRQYLVGRALELMQAEFEPATWQACWRHVVQDQPAAEVAAALGLSVNAVYIAKCRVLRRLREELHGLLG